jgi:phage tail-like protein
MPSRRDPYASSRFKLEIKGVTQGSFSECSGFDVTTDPIEYRNGDDEGTMRKQPGLTKYGNITLKWGLTDSTVLWDWRKKVIDGDIQNSRTNGSIVIMDEMGNEAVRWNFTNGWPSKYDPSDLNAKGNDVAIETLEITHEGLRRG